MFVSVIWTSDHSISGAPHCILHCYNSLPVLVWHFQQSHILRQKVLLDLFGQHLCVEETGSEKCESHWSGVENWLQQQDRCWAAVCPRFGLVPSVILGATTPAFSYIPILDLFSYLIVHVQHHSMRKFEKMHNWLFEVPPSGSSLVHFKYLSLMKLQSTNVTMKMVGYVQSCLDW